MLRWPLIAAFSAMASADQVQFGLGDLQESPGASWRLVEFADLQPGTFKQQFIDQYNKEGIPLIKSFKSGNCCLSLKTGKLIIAGTKYGFQFPALLNGGIHCNPSNGYTAGNYKLFTVPKLEASMKFTSKEACSINHNPALYVKKQGIKFGIYDVEQTPAGGWMPMRDQDFQTHKAAFVQFYNQRNGLPVIKTFKSNNCCIAIAQGDKLIVSGSKYGYQFPAISGGIRCNPEAGYQTGQAFQFLMAPKLSMDTKFSSRAACKTDHNPAIYMWSPPTPAPTPVPTAFPTRAPTRAPTNPTPAPTTAPTRDPVIHRAPKTVRIISRDKGNKESWLNQNLTSQLWFHKHSNEIYKSHFYTVLNGTRIVDKIANEPIPVAPEEKASVYPLTQTVFQTCTHTRCHLAREEIDGAPATPFRVMVLHHNEESHGDQVKCRYRSSTERCDCMCHKKSEKVAFAPTPSPTGFDPLAAANNPSTQCENQQSEWTTPSFLGVVSCSRDNFRINSFSLQNNVLPSVKCCATTAARESEQQCYQANLWLNFEVKDVYSMETGAWSGCADGYSMTSMKRIVIRQLADGSKEYGLPTARCCKSKGVVAMHKHCYDTSTSAIGNEKSLTNKATCKAGYSVNQIFRRSNLLDVKDIVAVRCCMEHDVELEL